ncbi:MAG: RNA pyrophosphohydrolase [Candidatus Anoxychlamydiales bacterium]|nr:RNA pyrophosphohydrolase [Candidatus Anoxychlamydiales bacterium]
MDIKDQSVISVCFSDDRKQVLLIKRRDVPVWVLPGGAIEENESFEEACERETFEETGYQVKILKKVAEYTPINKLSKYTHFYECQIISGKAKITDESKDIKFFNIDNLPKRLPPPYPYWIEDAFLNKKFIIKKKIFSVNYRSLILNLLKHPILVIRFLLTKIGLTINT